MTKRALSLLLTLVMVLSLCVPALAADEFEAETAAVAEEEQAPVAPVEPEALEETEEAEAVAAPAEADEPAPAYQYESDTPEVKLLRGAVEAVEAMEADLIAGKYISMGVQVSGQAYFYQIFDYVKGNDDLGVELVLDELAEARDLLDEVEKYQENTSLINAAYTFLYDVVHNDRVTKTVAPSGQWVTWILNMKNYLTHTAAFSAKDLYGDGYSNGWWTACDVTSEDAEDWYQPEYLARAEALVEAITKAQKSLNYADVKAIVDEFTELVEPFRKMKDDQSEYSVWGDAYKALGSDVQLLYDESVAARAAMAGKSKLSINECGIEDHLDTVDYWLELNYGSGVLTSVLRKHVIDMYETLVSDVKYLHDNVYSVSISRYDVNNGYDGFNLYMGRNSLKCDKTCPLAEKHFEYEHDDHKYTVKYSINGGTERIATDATKTQIKDWGYGMFHAAGNSNGDYVITIKPAGTDNTGRFENGDVIKVTLYDENGTVVQTVNVTIDKSYAGPVIVAAGYEPDAYEFDKIAAKWGKREAAATHVDDNFYVFLSSGPDNKYDEVTFTITNPDGKTEKHTIKYDNTEKNSLGYWTKEVKSFTVSNLPVVVGDWTVTMDVHEKSTDETVTRGTATITVPNITAYKNYAVMQEQMAKAAGYENMVKKAGSVQSTADLHQAIANALKAGQKIVADHATSPNIKLNRDSVDAVIASIKNALDKLVEPGSLAALQAAIDEAKGLVRSDFTEASWKQYKNDIDKAVTAGEKVVASKPGSDKDSKKIIEDATKAITDLLDKLVVKQARLTALKALIDSVPARLAADNYTSESKAAVNAAVAEAEPLLTAKGVMQSKVDAAAAKLEDALNALTVIPAGDPSGVQPPKGGTGWVYDPTTGADYYFINGEMKKDYWVGDHDGASKWNFWYYLGSDGKLVTGFHYITNPNGTGWYMLQDNNKNGCRGKMLDGWQYTNTAAGTGYFTETRGVNYGKCTQTNVWGAYNPADNTWGSAHTAH